MKDHHRMRVWDGSQYWYANIPFEGPWIRSESGKKRHLEEFQESSDIEEWELCTGLKDQDGKMIFEGDIILYSGTEDDDDFRYRQETVEYHPLGGFSPFHESFGSRSGYLYSSSIGYSEYVNEDKDPDGIGDYVEHDWPVKVIGNIHQNPELLENHK